MALAGGGLAGAALAACGGLAQCSSGPSAQNATPVVVEWRHSASSDAAVQRWTDFHTDVKAALAPKYDVRLNFESSQMWEKLQVEYAGGAGPDVVYNQVG